MDVKAVISALAEHKDYSDQIGFIKTTPASEAKYQPLNTRLAPKLGSKLRSMGFKSLYSHQAQAIELARKGKNFVVVTPTASGKSMCYNLPVLDHLLKEKRGKALYLFPTKALSQDQKSTIDKMDLGVKAHIYDGDTPTEVRGQIRERSEIVITNPDMLNKGILPNHPKWSNLFRDLKYIVIDEVHYYRGVFGTHMGHLLRRLRRIAAYYGAKPQFILCSATIANPKEHGQRITGVDLELIAESGAPKPEQTVVFWQPPSMVSYLKEVSWLVARLVQLKLKTIAFSRARQVAERIVKDCRKRLDSSSMGQVMSYRSGYLAEERREIEQALFAGEITAVVSTNALELGIDVGDLDVCLVAGFPGTVSSLWQQAGRAGRSGGHSLVIFVTVATPLDQYFATNPQSLFQKAWEEALIDPENPYLLYGHLCCAAHEIPLSREDISLWGQPMVQLIPLMAEDGVLEKIGHSYYYMGGDYPAEQVDLRSCGGNINLREKGTNRLIGFLDTHRAINEAHSGAVYMHQGESYLVQELDLERNQALLVKKELSYYTMVKSNKETEILSVIEEKQWNGMTVFYGQLRVTSQVTGFIKKHNQSGQVLGEEKLDLPEQVLETTGMWFVLDGEREKLLSKKGFQLMGSLHAVEHGAIGMLPLMAMCDRNDVGGLSTNMHKTTKAPTVFIHDGYPGGVGFSQQAYLRIGKLMDLTYNAISKCQCEDGCLNCIHSPKCSNFNRPLDKDGALFLLKQMLGGERDEFIPTAQSN
ncbi:DEAD/DEAH box helicase domain-containing protein [Desulfitispora alkaliphila]|uniref:DEAD/DEAH box helicase n=1 Tax=Desulfitispora alkaliphila TaxID=622674 RepID=UPI003D1F5336